MKPRKGKLFFRGIHVPDRKELARDSAIEVFDAPDVAVISLSQHIGKPAEPVVAQGDYVEMGQLIGKKSGFVGANIFSSVSGTVTGIEKRRTANGALNDFVVIENDRLDKKRFLPPLTDREPETIKARITEAGIVGMGGAGFPTDVKLSPKTPVDTLIINAAECEPYLTCDFRLMVEKTEEVVCGIRLLAKAVGVSNIVIGIEKNKPEAIEAFSAYENLQVVILRKAYPMGSEKHLIYCCTGRKVAPGKLPSDAGCVVQNVASAYAVYEAVELNKPLYERVMTVSGDGAVMPKNLLVRTGTSFYALRQYCGAKDDVKMFVCGGPMMGPAMLSTDVLTTKTTSGFLMLTDKEADINDPTPCINCGACADVCPMKLLPMQIDFYTQAGDYEKAAAIGGVKNCISCGCCAYVCPAKRALVQSITLCKAKLAENKGGK